MCLSNCPAPSTCVDNCCMAVAPTPSMEELGRMLRGMQGLPMQSVGLNLARQESAKARQTSVMSEAVDVARTESWMQVTEPEGFDFGFINDTDDAAEAAPKPEEEEEEEAASEAAKGCIISEEYLATRPCDHNNWDNVRAKKKQIFLRCRECDRQWRVPACMVKRCMAFLIHGKCALGTACPRLHLHLRKQSLEERLAAHGAPVLAKAQRGSPAASTPTTPTTSGEIPDALLPAAEHDAPRKTSRKNKNKNQPAPTRAPRRASAASSVSSPSASVPSSLAPSPQMMRLSPPAAPQVSPLAGLPLNALAMQQNPFAAAVNAYNLNALQAAMFPSGYGVPIRFMQPPAQQP